MKWLEHIQNMKLVLVIIAIVIAVSSLLTSNFLITDLQNEERNNMEVWAEAMRSLNAADENTDLNLVLKVINGNNSIPVIAVDNEGKFVSCRNIDKDFVDDEDSVTYLENLAEDYIEKGRVVRIDLPDEYGKGEFLNICYDDSLMLRRLSVFPYIQFGVVVIFVVIAIFALFATTKAEQNKVWVGLSKETAHQLGTPISSLMAWTEVLKEQYPDDSLLPEMEKDISRLERIADRFSKIGSVSEPKPEDVTEVLNRVVLYMQKRFGNKVTITTHFPDDPVIVNLISSLFEWVAENLCKNAIDAMEGTGKIDIYVEDIEDEIFIEFRDTGKGIPKSNFNSVFKPGFTTKERGWGLGLSLARRIVVEYHKGKIFVKESQIGKGTTFRVELPKGKVVLL